MKNLRAGLAASPIRTTRRLGWLIAAVLVGAALLPGFAGAQHDPPGNNGTVKIDGVPFDVHPDNEPHVGCIFQVEWFGFDAAVTSHVIFEVHPPTGVTATLLEDFVPLGPSDASGGGSIRGFDAEREYDLSAPLAAYSPHPNQGYHVKLTIHTEGSIGADTKHKVFWVLGCPPPPTPIPTPTPTPTPLETLIPTPVVTLTPTPSPTPTPVGTPTPTPVGTPTPTPLVTPTPTPAGTPTPTPKATPTPTPTPTPRPTPTPTPKATPPDTAIPLASGDGGPASGLLVALLFISAAAASLVLRSARRSNQADGAANAVAVWSSTRLAAGGPWPLERYRDISATRRRHR